MCKFNLANKLRYIPFIIVLCIVAILATPAIPVNAIADPTTITLTSGKVFQNVAESGDMLFIGHGRVYYTPSYPTTPASTNFLYAIYDGATLKSSAGISAYSYGVYGLYFTKAQVTALTLSWGTAYSMKLKGNPAIFTTTIEGTNQATRALSASDDWITGTIGATGTTQTLLRDYLINYVAIPLASPSELNTTLTVTTSTGVFLNTAGSALFTAAIPNLANICPGIFQTTSTDIQVTKNVFTNAYETELSMTNQLGAQIKTSFDGLALTFLGDANKGRVMASLWAMMLMLFVASIAFLYTGNTVASMICTIPMFFLAVWVGAIPLTMLILIAAGIMIYMAYHLFLRGL